MSRETLVHAALSRAGLGNMLFPWARAEVFSRRFRVPMLAPRWTQPRIGPLLRGEKDLRFYTGLFDNRSYVRGPSRMLALLSRKRADGHSIGINRNPAVLPQSDRGALVVFEGWHGWFRDDLPYHRELVRQRLQSILTDRVRAEIRAFDKPLTIALHVRRGDMAANAVPPGGEMGGPNENVVQSEYYFLSVLRTVRRIAGKRLPATVFTDARQGELKEVTAEEGVYLAGTRSVIADLWCMSQSAILITSSASSFSAWGSYLGGMPTIWQRTRVGLVLPERPDLAIESDPHGTISERGREVILERLDHMAKRTMSTESSGR